MRVPVLAAVAAVLLSLSGVASAATLTLAGGSSGYTPAAKAKNDALKPLGFGKQLQGYYGAQVWLKGSAHVTFTLFGYEAGYTNKLFSGKNVLTGGGGHKFSKNGMGSFTLSNVAAGLLDFGFWTSGGKQTVKNGKNPDNTGRNPFPGINFFATFADTANSRKGNSLWLFFDDDGANNDDDHDDLVARVDVAPVPVPAAGLLLLGALGGLAVLRRRQA
ncbi:MAG: VPLPA-CTERM sorting domain-containing protein [Paracoccaceae bacterium]